MKENKSKISAINDLLGEVAEIPPMIFTRIKFALLDQGELTPVLLSVIMMLRNKPNGLRMSDISKRISATMPTATGIIDRLVKRELVVRCDDPDDRRVVIVKLTQKGRKAGTEFENQIRNLWHPVVDGLNNEEKKQFLALIRKIKTLILGEMQK